MNLEGHSVRDALFCFNFSRYEDAQLVVFVICKLPEA